MRYLTVKWLALLLLALAVGCGGPEHEPLPNDGAALEPVQNHGFGFEYSLIAPDGTRFRNDPSIVLDQAQFETLIAEPFHEVERCARILTVGPLVVVDNHIVGRTYFHDDPLVTVMAGVLQADSRDFPVVLKHEYVHYLLAVSGFPDDLNTTHQSPLFVACSGLPN